MLGRWIMWFIRKPTKQYKLLNNSSLLARFIKWFLDTFESLIFFTKACVWVRLCVCTLRLERIGSILCCQSLPHPLETGSLPELRASVLFLLWLGWLASKSWSFYSFSSSRRAGVTGVSRLHLNFYMGAGALNSGPHGCTARAPPPHPLNHLPSPGDVHPSWFSGLLTIWAFSSHFLWTETLALPRRQGIHETQRLNTLHTSGKDETYGIPRSPSSRLWKQ